MHPHGAFYAKDSDGAPYNDGTGGDVKADDAVPSVSLSPPGGRPQQRHVAVVGAESAQLALAVSDFTLELVDQTQTRLDRALPRFRQPEPGEQLPTGHAEEIGHRARLAVSEQGISRRTPRASPAGAGRVRARALPS